MYVPLPLGIRLDVAGPAKQVPGRVLAPALPQKTGLPKQNGGVPGVGGYERWKGIETKMIPERDKRLASILASLDSNFHTTDRDILWLLEEIKRLDQELETIRDNAIDDAIERDLST